MIPETARNAPDVAGAGEARAPQKEWVAAALDVCVAKARRNIARLADDPERSSWSWHPEGAYWDRDENFFEIGNWTTSFITGMALLAFKKTGDTFFLKQTLRLAPLYRLKVFEHDMDTMHDLGFLYSLYSVALYRLTGDGIHRETGLRAAELLSGRFIEKGRFIRAWGRMDREGVGTREDGFIRTDDLAIIDCMMNLPLLHWAAEQTGEKRFRDVAVAHADTTLANFIRPDDSLFHAYRFDLATGEPKQGENYCGCAVDSHWARGTAWAIYGFAISYRYTRNAACLEAAQRLSRRFIANLDAHGIPVWDFRLKADAPRLRDSSAAAIAVCGFQELERLGAADASISFQKDLLLGRLCSDEYLNPDEACGGLLRNGQVGRALNTYTSWGDYYLMEALSREVGVDPGFW